MTGEPTKKRPEQSVDDPQAALVRLQKFTKSLLRVDKQEYDQKRKEYEKEDRQERRAN